jgi:hypothetical protein
MMEILIGRKEQRNDDASTTYNESKAGVAYAKIQSASISKTSGRDTFFEIQTTANSFSVGFK